MPSAVVDLFCGIGGLTHGLQLAGLNVVAGIDVEESCQYAYEQNNQADFMCRDITTLNAQEIFNLYDGYDVRILVGCAPCQPFSKYTKRYRKDGFVDDKWRLLYSFSNLIEEVRPQIVSMENVPDLARENIFQEFLDKLEELEYHVDWRIAYCPDYGVPQHRKRLVLLASTINEITLIPPLFQPETYRTVRGAIEGLAPLGDGEVDPNDFMHRTCRLSATNRRRIRQSVQGGTWRDWDEDLQLACHKKHTGRSYPSVYGRMFWDRPSPTITTQFYGLGNGRFGHPEQNRALSLREGAILQSFPPNYDFIGNQEQYNKRTLGTHIGNAVPVELGRAIGISINNHLQEAGLNG